MPDRRRWNACSVSSSRRHDLDACLNRCPALGAGPAHLRSRAAWVWLVWTDLGRTRERERGNGNAGGNVFESEPDRRPDLERDVWPVHQPADDAQILLLGQLDIFNGRLWEFTWPLMLIALGVWLMIRRMGHGQVPPPSSNDSNPQNGSGGAR